MEKLLATIAVLSALAVGPVDANPDRASAKTAQKMVATGVIVFWGDGGVGFFRWPRPAELERRSGLYDLPALHLWRLTALPHDGGLQPQAEAAAAGTAFKEVMQAYLSPI